MRAMRNETCLSFCWWDKCRGGQGGPVALRNGIYSPFRFFKTFSKIMRPAVMLGIRFQLSLRISEDLLQGRGIDISCETVRFW